MKNKYQPTCSSEIDLHLAILSPVAGNGHLIQRRRMEPSQVECVVFGQLLREYINESGVSLDGVADVAAMEGGGVEAGLKVDFHSCGTEL